MCIVNRRSALGIIAGALPAFGAHANAAAPEGHRDFIAAAFRMKDEAVRSGDQPYGAVVVLDGRIVGFGPSRVVLNKDRTAHAEREALRDAQARLGTKNLSGGVLYSTSRPCGDCERAAAAARISRMIHGAEAIDAGPPAGAGSGE
jgi:tRNA(Arg) A34 adenosine deaminase TadA